MPNQEERRMIKMLWSMVSKAAERSRRQRHDTFRDPVAFMRVMDVELFQWNDVCSRRTGVD